jgi:hypothetical protein
MSPSVSNQAFDLDLTTLTLLPRPSRTPPEALPETGVTQAPAAIPVEPDSNPQQDCTRTLQYWLDHPDLWLTDNLIIGRQTFNQAAALEFLRSPVQDETRSLLRQFIIAALNQLNGADPAPVRQDMNQAIRWLDAHPVGVLLSDAERQEAAELFKLLLAYNNGELGPVLCPGQPTEAAPPTMTRTPTPEIRFTQTNSGAPTDGPGIPAPGTPRPTEAEGSIITKAPSSPQPPPPSDEPPEPTNEPPPAPTNPPPPTNEPPEPTDEPPPPTSAPPPVIPGPTLNPQITVPPVEGPPTSTPPVP